MDTNIDDNLISIFKGNFKTVPEPNSSTIRIFLSSTFTGMFILLPEDLSYEKEKLVLQK
jgi:hypothetical protein